MRLTASLFRLLCLFVCALGAASLSVADQPPPLRFPAAQGETDLVADPAIVAGVLPNGLRYALRPNSEPRSRVSLRLVVAAGSFHENDEQRGLAHFLEHMAFNGSTHYPAGTLIEFFQRMGMNFGGDTNAYTSFDHTVYQLDLPDAKPETLAEGLRVLGDFAGGLSLLPAEIDRERGIILSEKLTSDSADERADIAGCHFFLSNTRVPGRLVIGDASVIKSAGRDRFVDFYDTWYRPERMAVVIVGDLDPVGAEKALREQFTPLAARAPDRPVPVLFTPADPAAPRFGYHHESEASATTVTFQTVSPPDDSPDSSARRLRNLPLELSGEMFDRRLSEQAKAEDAPFVRAITGRDWFPGVFDGASLALVSRPGKWAETLIRGENELRRSLAFGFGADELREVVATRRNALEQAVKTAATRRSDERADELVQALVYGDIPTPPEADLALIAPALASLTPEACHEAWKAAWSSAAGRRVTVIGNTLIGDDKPGSAERAIAAALAVAEARPVAPPAERADTPWGYTDFGPAGQVVSRTEISDLGITQVVFANGVRLNLKRTDFEADSISLIARVGTGQLTEPRDQPGLAFFAGAAFTAGGVGKHSDDELRRILAGRNVGLGLRVDDDALVFNAGTTPADLTLQLQLMTAQIGDPGYRPEAELASRRRMEPLYTSLATQPQGPLNIDAQRILVSGDTRFGYPRKEEALARTFAELRAWLAPQLATGPIELSLVGDLDIETAITAVAATLGTLPPRDAKPVSEALRQVKITAPGEHSLTYAGAIAKDILAIYWPTDDFRDVGRKRRLALLGQIMDDRLIKIVREQLGGSYSPTAGSMASESYRNLGFLVAQVETNPAELERVRAAVIEVAADLAAHGVTEDELDRARLPLLTSLRETDRSNAYWLNTVLAAAQEQPQRLDWARSRHADFTAITKPELDELAARYLAPARAITFTIRPAPASATP